MGGVVGGEHIIVVALQILFTVMSSLQQVDHPRHRHPIPLIHTGASWVIGIGGGGLSLGGEPDRDIAVAAGGDFTGGPVGKQVGNRLLGVDVPSGSGRNTSIRTIVAS